MPSYSLYRTSCAASQNRLRRGVSFLEFVSYLIAMMVGVVGGSIYLGIDIRAMAIDVLEKAELIEPGALGELAPEEEDLAEAVRVDVAETSAAPAADTTPCKATPAAAEEAVLDLATPLALEEGAVPIAEDNIAEETNSEAPALPPLTEEQRELRTQAYWQLLVESMRAEASGRMSGIRDPANWQLYDYLTQRSTGHGEAVGAIEQFETHGVDARLVSHGLTVLSWHRAGQQLYGRAVNLLTDAPSAALTGPFAQSWQSSATQHRMEEKLLRDKHGAVAGYLSHMYKSVGDFAPAFSK